MPLLDFKEIPYEDDKGKKVDTFEHFARDFLEDFGLEILDGPDRGPDGGKDIIAKETSDGVLTSTEFTWLVSCKHNAHSGKSVSPTDEQNITDRVKQHSCDGFMGFYSTLPSSGLSNRLKNLDIDYHVFDRELIEKNIKRDLEGYKLIERYFPESYKNFITENPTPSNIFDRELEINCDVCGDNLLKKETGGVLALGEKKQVIEDIYLACRGSCDGRMEAQFMERGLFDMWFELADFKIPLTFFHQLMTINQGFKNEYEFSDTANFKLEKLFLISFQQVARNQTKKEQDRVNRIIDRDQLLDSYGI